MAKRVFNFNPGPATLPLDVLKIVQDELLDYRGTGMSILESSHRAPEYDEINNQAMALAKEIFSLGDDYKVLFMTGGASTQFALIPMNFAGEGQVGAYVDTGSWSSKAIKEAEIQGKAYIAASSKGDEYTYIPKAGDISYPDNTAYLHITTNNTIRGTQYHEIPDSGSVPLIADMSSDIASRQMDYKKFALIYAGAQKNIGPAGLTVVIVRDDLIGDVVASTPTMFNYATMADSDSMYNTPPTYSWYLAGLVFKWLLNNGGLEGMAEKNERKASKLYAAIDNSGFYNNPVDSNSRSWMNVPFTLANQDLDATFLEEAKEAGLVTLKGHRSVGGMRASIYNAMPEEGVDALINFMADFEKRNG